MKKRRNYPPILEPANPKEQPIVVSDDLSRIEFTLENRTGGTHETGLSVSGLPGGYRITVGGIAVAVDASGLVKLPVSGGAVRVRIER